MPNTYMDNGHTASTTDMQERPIDEPQSKKKRMYCQKCGEHLNTQKSIANKHCRLCMPQPEHLQCTFHNPHAKQKQEYKLGVVCTMEQRVIIERMATEHKTTPQAIIKKLIYPTSTYRKSTNRRRSWDGVSNKTISIVLTKEESDAISIEARDKNVFRAKLVRDIMDIELRLEGGV